MPRDGSSSSDRAFSASRPNCCLCHAQVVESGWCENCRTWPVNVTPIRYCASGHRVSVTGWCAQCVAYVLTDLDPQPGEWVDTGRMSRKLTKAEVHALAHDVTGKFSGPGWPDTDVPLRVDMIPRRWKRGALQKIALTSLGYPIVLPETAPDPAPDGDVPF